MIDNVKPLREIKGHFTIQTFDKSGKMLSEEKDPNLIMDNSRSAMAKNISGLPSKKSIDKIILGTLGSNNSIVIPKSSVEGLISSRNRLFSESIDASDTFNQAVLKNDLIRYTGTANTTGTTNNYYTYIGVGETINASTVNFADTTLFTDLGATAPYTYSVGFTSPAVSGDYATNIVEIDQNSTVIVTTGVNNVTYTIDISNNAGNNSSSEIYSEAALYAGTDIFSMKTFRGKIKDASVLLRIIWKIQF